MPSASIGAVTDGFVVPADAGRAIDLPGWSMRLKVGADSTDGALTVIHGEMDASHAGPAEHIHDDHDETFVVLEGALRFRLGDRYRVADEGATVHCPRGQAHGFSNPFERPATYVVMLSPSGYEGYFERVADHFHRTGRLPDPSTTDEWMAELNTRRARPAEPEH